MSTPATTILEEASDLHRFLQPISRLTDVSRRDHPYYSHASYEFFKYVRELATASLQFLEQLHKRPGRFRETQHSIRVRLKSLRDSWGLLHRYIKPCLDADALHSPLPLMNALDDKLKAIPGCKDIEFALFLLMALNYVTPTYEEVNSVADRIARVVTCRQFPPDLSLVGIPYSQSSGLLLNCLIPHEMGHFVFQKLVRPEAQARIDEILGRQYPDQARARSKRLWLSSVRGLLNSWIEEVFCDLFAISIIGPAFTFALAELSSASLIADEPVTDEKTTRRLPESFRFSAEHPADVARFYLQRLHLESLGWWKHIQNWKSRSIELLRHCEKARERVVVSDEIPKSTRNDLDLQCFWTASEWIREYTKEKFPAQGDEIVRTAKNYKTISKYLTNAIVPSTIITAKGAVYPSPTELLNAAYRFVHEDFEKLLHNIERDEPNPVWDRSHYQERLETWILKALDDHRMLTASGGRSKRGSPVQETDQGAS